MGDIGFVWIVKKNGMKEKVKSLRAEMRELGKARYERGFQRLVEGNEFFKTRPGARIVRKFIHPVASLINERREKYLTGKPTLKSEGSRHLIDYDPYLLALIALRSITESLNGRAPVNSVALRMARLVMMEINAHLILSDPSKQIVLHRVNRIHSQHRQAKRTLIRDNQIFDWNIKQLAVIGAFLLQCVLDATGLFEIEMESLGGGKKRRLVSPTPAFLKWIKNYNEYHSAITPMYLPTLMAPEPWVELDRGGYKLDDELSHGDFFFRVRTADQKQKYCELLNNKSISHLFEAVNMCQNTAWTINSKVLGVVKELWENNVEVGSLCRREIVKFPKRPDSGSPAAMKAWRKTMAFWRHKNMDIKLERASVSRMLWMAERFDQKVFFFPHNMDFRGRLYPFVTGLSPQGTDLARGLLQFGQFQMITKQKDMDWIMIRGANAYGQDKKTFSNRIKWVISNQDQILAAANDPIRYVAFWSKAEEPFQFLAFCFEYEQWMAKGWVETRLPILLDATSSVYQMVAMLFRDEDLAALTNLRSNPIPADFYKYIQDQVQERFCKIGTHDPVFSKISELEVTRELIKALVMPYMYGSTKHTAVTILQRWLQDNHPKEFWFSLKQKGLHAIVKELYGLVDRSLPILPKAREWLVETGKNLARGKTSVVFWSELGMPIIQECPGYKSKIFKTYLTGIASISILEPTGKQSMRQHGLSFPANFIHSLDASILHMVLMQLNSSFIKSVMAVHDCFGTHANYVEDLRRLIRQAYFKIFKNPLIILGKLQTGAATPGEHPLFFEQLPTYTQGTFDLNKVLDADYIVC